MLDISIPKIVVDATSHSPSMVSLMCRPITCVTAHVSLHRGDGYCSICTRVAAAAQRWRQGSRVAAAARRQQGGVSGRAAAAEQRQSGRAAEPMRQRQGNGGMARAALGGRGGRTAAANY
jgi:hypothetical protein